MQSQGKPEKTPRSAAEILEVVLDHVAEEAAESGEFTEEDERWAEELHGKMRARVAEMRRQLTRSRPPIDRAVPISVEIHALGREELLAKLAAQSQGGAVQHAHLTGLTDDDLR